MFSLEVLFGCLVFLVVGAPTGLYMAVQLVLAIVRRQRHRPWSSFWLAGCFTCAAGILCWCNCSDSNLVLVPFGVLAIPATMTLWFLSVILFRASVKRRREQTRAAGQAIGGNGEAWPPPPRERS